MGNLAAGGRPEELMDTLERLKDRQEDTEASLVGTLVVTEVEGSQGKQELLEDKLVLERKLEVLGPSRVEPVRIVDNASPFTLPLQEVYELQEVEQACVQVGPYSVKSAENLLQA